MNIKQEILMSLNHYAKIFRKSEHRATRKPKNWNMKHSITVRSCLDNNFYYVNDLLIIMNIK